MTQRPKNPLIPLIPTRPASPFVFTETGGVVLSYSSMSSIATPGVTRHFLENAPIHSIKKNSTSSINTTLIVSFGKEGSVKGVFKPAEGELLDGRANIELGTLWRNEVAASRLNDALRPLGFDMVPMTVARTVDGQIGSLQLFVNGARPATRSDVLDRAVAEKFKVFDYITGNSDRHIGNVLVVNREGKNLPVLIDNGLAFPNGGNLFWKFPDSLLGGRFGPFLHETLVFISSIDPNLVASVLAASQVSRTATEHVLRRLEFLKANPSFLSNKTAEWAKHYSNLLQDREVLRKTSTAIQTAKAGPPAMAKAKPPELSAIEMALKKAEPFRAAPSPQRPSLRAELGITATLVKIAVSNSVQAVWPPAIPAMWKKGE